MERSEITYTAHLLTRVTVSFLTRVKISVNVNVIYGNGNTFKCDTAIVFCPIELPNNNVMIFLLRLYNERKQLSH